MHKGIRRQADARLRQRGIRHVTTLLALAVIDLVAGSKLVQLRRNRPATLAAARVAGGPGRFIGYREGCLTHAPLNRGLTGAEYVRPDMFRILRTVPHQLGFDYE